jgi:hypothetical protein
VFPNPPPPLQNIHACEHVTAVPLLCAVDSAHFWEALQLRRARDRESELQMASGSAASGSGSAVPIVARKPPDVFITLPGAHHAFNFLTSARALSMGDAVMDWLNCVYAGRASAEAGAAGLEPRL